MLPQKLPPCKDRIAGLRRASFCTAARPGHSRAPFVGSVVFRCSHLIFSPPTISPFWPSTSPITALLAVGMTFVVLTGGIDLSVGSIAGLAAGMVAGYLLTQGIWSSAGRWHYHAGRRRHSAHDLRLSHLSEF